ncbi:hypothetical protein AAY473_000037 [Plecturocebus cupreus]
MEMPQARDQASQTPNQRHRGAKGEKMDSGRAGIPSHGALPRRAGEGRRGHGGRTIPHPRSPSTSGPLLGPATSLTAQPGNTETSPPTPPPAESREDAELGLRSGGHRPGHGPTGGLWAKFRVATAGGVGEGKAPADRVSSRTTLGSGCPGPISSLLTDPLHLLGPHSPRPTRLRQWRGLSGLLVPPLLPPLSAKGKSEPWRTVQSDAET